MNFGQHLFKSAVLEELTELERYQPVSHLRVNEIEFKITILEFKNNYFDLSIRKEGHRNLAMWNF